jgi:hypothetical protein
MDNIISKVIINEQEYIPRNKWSALEDIDIRKDDGRIEIITTSEIPFRRKEDVELQMTDKLANTLTFDFIINQDRVVQISRNPNQWSHTIHLIERTKLLDDKKMSSLSYTQPIDRFSPRYETLKDMADRAINLLPLETDDYFASNRYIKGYDFVLENALINNTSFQTNFDEPTAFEVLFGLTKKIDAIPRLLKGNILSADFFNVNRKVVALKDDVLVDLKVTSNNEYYCTAIESNVKNITNDKDLDAAISIFPYPGGYTTIRSTNGYISDDSASLDTPEEVQKLEFFKVRNQSGEEIDLINFSVNESVYDTLLTGGFISGSIVPKKQNTIYFTNKQFLGFGEESKVGAGGVFITPSWVEIIKSALNDEINRGKTFTVPSNLRDLLWQIGYVAKISNTRIRSHRETLDQTNKETIQTSNQSERINDFNAQGTNVFGQAQRLGNDEYEITMTYTEDISKILPLQTKVFNRRIYRNFIR